MLPIEKRKDIVKERVSIGKLHDRAHGNDQKVRNEPAVLLQQCVLPLRCEGKSRCSRHWLQPYDCRNRATLASPHRSKTKSQ